MSLSAPAMQTFKKGIETGCTFIHSCQNILTFKLKHILVTKVKGGIKCKNAVGHSLGLRRSRGQLLVLNFTQPNTWSL